MAEQAKPVTSRNGEAGFRPGGLAIALGVSLALLLLFDLLTRAHF
ncbi:hypothetical protein [Acidisoma sp. 7E03]